MRRWSKGLMGASIGLVPGVLLMASTSVVEAESELGLGAWGARLAVVGMIVGEVAGLCWVPRVGRQRDEEPTGGSVRGAFGSLTVAFVGAVLCYVTTQRPFTPGTSVVELLIPAGALVTGVLGIDFGIRTRHRASKGERARVAATVGVVFGGLVAVFAAFALALILLLCAPVDGRLVC